MANSRTWLLLGVLCTMTSLSAAQSGAPGVPSARPSGSYVGDVASGCDAGNAASGTACATGIMGNALDTARTMNNAAIWRGASEYSAAGQRVLDRTGTTIGVIGDGARLYDAWGKGTLGPEAAQVGLERGIDLAVETGLGLYMGPQLAPAGMAVYGAGKVVGTLANQFIRPCNNSRGESQTLNDCLNDHVYLPAMDAWQNREVERLTSQEAIDAARQRLRDRARDFESTAARNDAAAAQAAADQAEMRSPVQDTTTYDPGPANSINALMTIIGAAAAPPPRSAAPGSPTAGRRAAAGTCTTLDPKTGCHVGHDEKAHPGGCKKC